MTLFEKIKEAIRLSDKVGRSRGSNCYALDKQAVDRLVVLEIGLEAEIKAALDAKDAEIAALKAERDALRQKAVRYDWLRNNTKNDWAICEWHEDAEGYYRDCRAPAIVDAAIDAAMQAQGVKSS